MNSEIIKRNEVFYDLLKVSKTGKVVATDPWYGKDVDCRYVSEDNIDDTWECELFIEDTINRAQYDNKDFEYGDMHFIMMLRLRDKRQFCYLHLDEDEDGNVVCDGTYCRAKTTFTKDYDIGCDTARVAFGIDNFDDAICTGADGYVAGLVEIKDKDYNVVGIFIDGGFDSNLVSLNKLKTYLIGNFYLTSC